MGDANVPWFAGPILDQLAAKEHKRRLVARWRGTTTATGGTTTARGSRATGGMTTVTGGKTMATSSSRHNNGRHDDGKGQQGKRQHNNGDGRHHIVVWQWQRATRQRQGAAGQLAALWQRQASWRISTMMVTGGTTGKRLLTCIMQCVIVLGVSAWFGLCGIIVLTIKSDYYFDFFFLSLFNASLSAYVAWAKQCPLQPDYGYLSQPSIAHIFSVFFLLLFNASSPLASHGPSNVHCNPPVDI
jgi:hypothetical protein